MTRATARSTRRLRSPSGRLPPAAAVRASVDRLEHLAGRGAPAGQLAAELRELERAVASMLGTAGPPTAGVLQRHSAPPDPTPERTVEWTTTGVVR